MDGCSWPAAASERFWRDRAGKLAGRGCAFRLASMLSAWLVIRSYTESVRMLMAGSLQRGEQTNDFFLPLMRHDVVEVLVVLLVVGGADHHALGVIRVKAVDFIDVFGIDLRDS